MCISYRPDLSLSFIETELAFDDRKHLTKFLQDHQAWFPNFDKDTLDVKRALPPMVASSEKYKKVDIKGQI